MECPTCRKPMTKSKVEMRVTRDKLSPFVAWVCAVCRAVVEVSKEEK
jgi:RNase P subunit RPR2